MSTSPTPDAFGNCSCRVRPCGSSPLLALAARRPTTSRWWKRLASWCQPMPGCPTLWSPRQQTQGLLDGIGAPSAIVRESTFGESRFDLMLEHENGRQYVEVKSVTLVENGVGLFPDSPTLRGAKHLNTLYPRRFRPDTAPPWCSWCSEPMRPGLRRQRTRPTRPWPKAFASCRCRGSGSLRLQLPRNPQRSAPRPSAADNSLRVHPW